MNAIEAMRGFEGPSALDLLTEFRKKFVTIAERRSRELGDILYARRDEGPSAELRDLIDEYESLRYFEQELNRVIGAFVNESTKPFRQAYADAIMVSSADMRGIPGVPR